MGTGKKEVKRREKQGKVGSGMNNVKTKGENFYRDAKKAKTLNMLTGGKAQRSATGRIVKSAAYQSREKPKARVEPNRRWFGNTRVISQDALNSFRQAIAERASDPYQVLLKSNKLPMTLVRDSESTTGLKQHQAKMQVESAPFSETFGAKSQRKRVKLNASSMSDLANESQRRHQDYLEKQGQQTTMEDHSASQEARGETREYDPVVNMAQEPVFLKGQSRRIWSVSAR